MKLLQWQRELLETSRVACLATIGRDGCPKLVPVCFALVDEIGGPGLPIVVSTIDEKPKRLSGLARLANITRDPRVTILVQRYDDDWQQLAWVRLEGQARVLTAGRDRPSALTALRARYHQYESMDLESRPLIVIIPVRVVSWRWQ